MTEIIGTIIGTAGVIIQSMISNNTNKKIKSNEAREGGIAKHEINSKRK